MKCFLKLIAGFLAQPLMFASVLGIMGLLLLRGGRRRSGVSMLIGSAALAYLTSTTLVGDALLWPLERQYPIFEVTQALAVRDIVVLGSGYEPSDHVPVTGAIDADGLARIVEGVRLALARPGSRLLVSGGATPGFTPSAWGYAQIAMELGIERSRLVVVDRALNTSQESRDVFALLGHAPFVLVTSAIHMPRAMQLMHRAGANPVAAPTAQAVRASHGNALQGLVPGSSGLRKTEAAIHEYLGLMASRLGID